MNKKLSGFDRSLLPSMEDYLKSIAVRLVGRGKQRRCKCPIGEHSSKDSFCVNVDTDAWWCHVCHLGGGDALALHRRLADQGFLEAARDLGAFPENEQTPRPPPA